MIKARFCVILLVISIVVGIVCPSDGVVSSFADNGETTAVYESDSHNAAIAAAFVVAAVVVVCMVCSTQSE